jgi:DNA repair protein RecN (Recombination protein N)
VLTTLRIRNLALVEDLTLELEEGYNVVTGETGAGKSILIGALNLVLGERADRTLIRSGSESCTVEAVFAVEKLKAPLQDFLSENGIEACEDAELIIKRSITTNGVNRQFVNGSPANLNALTTIGEWLVDIHGPHEHQSLLHSSKQLELLDAFAGSQVERDQFAELVRRRQALESEKAALVIDEKTYAQQLDLLRFQVNEISAARLRPGEEEELETEHHRAANAAKLMQLAQSAMDGLSENESSLLTQAGAVGRALNELKRIDPTAESLTQTHEQGISVLRDLQAELSRYSGKIEVDPDRLQHLEERLNLIHSLKRKYGSTLAEVAEFGDEARKRLEALEGRDAELQRLNRESQELEAEILRLGRTLHNKRHKAIPPLSKSVSTQLSDLGFEQSRFDVQLVHSEPVTTLATGHATRFPSSGFDTVEFQFAPNPGEPNRPLRAIASSGELARVMLALKTVLASEDRVPVLVFDEVDANVGGETANAVGEKMLQIAQKRQVICITHLPQVAAPASAHYLASKHLQGSRTISEITRLDKAERLTEVARMLGGQTEAARKHAAALLR